MTQAWRHPDYELAERFEDELPPWGPGPDCVCPNGDGAEHLPECPEYVEPLYIHRVKRLLVREADGSLNVPAALCGADIEPGPGQCGPLVTTADQLVTCPICNERRAALGDLL